MVAILGLSAFYHDSAAALVIDGDIVAAAQEERFTRVKHDSRFPQHSIRFCLDSAGIDESELDYVGFYDKPLLTFDRILESFLASAPWGYSAFRHGLPIWLEHKLHLPREIRQGIPKYKGPLVFGKHHESHAASAFFPSPFEEAAILTIDGVGEWGTSSIGFGSGNRIELKKQLSFPHSLGLLYSAFTYYLGFRVNSGEYKVMGLAPYGEPRFCDSIYRELIDLKEDGSFRLNMRYFNYLAGLTMTSARFHQLFGGAPRNPGTPLQQRDLDIAASIQCVAEEIMLRMARSAYRLTKSNQLVLSGGVALNCVGNGRISREGPFERIWVQPAAGDAGGSIGAALFIYHQLLNRSRHIDSNDRQRGSLLGPEYPDDSIRNLLEKENVSSTYVTNFQDICTLAAKAVDDGKVVGWFQGKMEFGPRALGNRSILGDARSPEMHSRINHKIKFRESFRPFAPIILQEHAHDYFELKPNQDSPYMLIVAPVADKIRVEISTTDAALKGLEKQSVRRSQLPSITHVDYSARIQTVEPQRNQKLYQLLATFYKLTGCPAMINTSFNVRGEPIVCTPQDALQCYLNTDMDCLAIGNFFVTKADSGEVNHQARQAFLDQFAAD